MKKISYSKLIFLFFTGSILGWILETGFTFFKYGHYIIKKGMVFGVFKPLYGFGIMVFYLVYKILKKKNPCISFCIGCFVGTVYEYMASLFETFVLGTNTWDYSNFKFNINGRIYLPYIFVWGLLYLLIIKLFPYLDYLYEKIKKFKIGSILLSLLVIFMSFNILITTLSFYRYSMREKDSEPKTFIGTLVDYFFDDEYMKKTFPRLRVVK